MCGTYNICAMHNVKTVVGAYSCIPEFCLLRSFVLCSTSPPLVEVTHAFVNRLPAFFLSIRHAKTLVRVEKTPNILGLRPTAPCGLNDGLSQRRHSHQSLLPRHLGIGRSMVP